MASSLLVVDSALVAGSLEEHIRGLLNTHSARGVLTGLSGGIDSGVLATLAVRALGKDRVHVCYLYDRDSDEELAQSARVLARWLGLELEVRDIEPAMQARGVYNALAGWARGASGASRYLFSKLYTWIFGESPFMSSLRRGRDPRRGLKQRVYGATVGAVEAGFDARHIYRRELLERQARDHNWLLMGAANRSEYLVGWFVKGGIDDPAASMGQGRLLVFSPLIGLYKTQVRQLAAYLGIPAQVQAQAPSPDMMNGLTDEFALGIGYWKLDIVLDGIERGLPDEEMAAAGVNEKEIRHVRQMNRLSSWKRGSRTSMGQGRLRAC